MPSHQVCFSVLYPIFPKQSVATRRGRKKNSKKSFDSGNVAPCARYKYSFTTVGAKSDVIEETTAAESDTVTSPDTEVPTEAPETEAPAKKGCKFTVPSAVIPLMLATSVIMSRKKKKTRREA
ncbi:MAG: hypothetical protein IJD38_09445 [Clostridia bacterium]|nr:hypothetical protein [Clostridia bacterium]